MSERPGEALWGDEQLEGALRDLGRDEHFPPTPDIAAAVGESLREEHSPRSPGLFQPLPRRLAAAAVIALLLAGAAVLAIPDARDGVADWLGIRSVAIVEMTATPADIPAAVNLGLGRPVTLDEARDEVRFPLLVPHSDKPGAIYLNRLVPGGQVSYVYQAREDLPAGQVPDIGLLITQFQATDAYPAAGKGLPLETLIEETEIDDWPALWIEGAPHTFVYFDATGQADTDTLRLADNVLLWERDGVLVRIEGKLNRDDAIAIAEAMHLADEGGE